MKALVKTAPGPGNLALLEVPEPAPGPGQVKIRVAAAGICGTDVHIVQGDFPVRPPLILGHELSGVIVEIGDPLPGSGAATPGLSVGDRVTTETDAYVCGICCFCRSGNEHLCPERKAIGTTADGGFAGYLAIRAASVHRLPEGVSFAAGALVEPLAVAVHAVHERGQVRPDELAVVIGPGTIGVLAAQVARALGARVVLAGLARHRARFRLAEQLGIEQTLLLDDPDYVERVLALDGGLGAHCVIECSGAQSAVGQAMRLLRKGGRLVTVGFVAVPAIELDLNLVTNWEISLLGSRGKRHSCWPVALEMLASGQVNVEALITHRYPLAEWPAAFATAQTGGAKVLLEISATGPGEV